MEMLLAAIAVVLVGRLFILGQSFIPSELIALVLLLPTLVLLHKLWAATRQRVMLLAFAAIFIFDRVNGDGQDAPTHFELWPFIAWRDAGWPINLQVLLKLLFEFTALTWLLREAGLALRTATALTVALVALLEILALWVPGRDAAITAPVLALAVGAALRYAGSSVTRPRVRSH